MVDMVIDQASSFLGGNGLKKRCVNLYFLSVVLFKLSQKNAVSLLFSGL